jgi:hypothetical protein
MVNKRIKKNIINAYKYRLFLMFSKCLPKKIRNIFINELLITSLSSKGFRIFH